MNPHIRSWLSTVPAARIVCATVLMAALIIHPELAWAADGDALPYEEGIDTFIESMTGPVPFVISLVGIVACGAMLIFGGEISGFMRTMVFIILVVAVIVQASSVVHMLGSDWQPKSSGKLSAVAIAMPAHV